MKLHLNKYSYFRSVSSGYLGLAIRLPLVKSLVVLRSIANLLEAGRISRLGRRFSLNLDYRDNSIEVSSLCESLDNRGKCCGSGLRTPAENSDDRLA